MKEFLTGLSAWQAQGEEIAPATALRVERSAPLPPGARLGVTRSGKIIGSVSGGCVESDVIERAIQTLDTGKPVVVNYGIADELGFQAGLSCGGSIDVLIESFYFIVGAETSLAKLVKTSSVLTIRLPSDNNWRQNSPDRR